MCPNFVCIYACVFTCVCVSIRFYIFQSCMHFNIVLIYPCLLIKCKKMASRWLAKKNNCFTWLSLLHRVCKEASTIYSSFAAWFRLNCNLFRLIDELLWDIDVVLSLCIGIRGHTLHFRLNCFHLKPAFWCDQPLLKLSFHIESVHSMEGKLTYLCVHAQMWPFRSIYWDYRYN